MAFRMCHPRITRFSLSAAAAALLLASLPSPAQTQAKTVSAVPPIVQQAKDLGAIDPAQDIHVTVWLSLANQAAFDSAVQALYTPGSPTSGKWMTATDLQKFAPTASSIQTVQKQLQQSGLTIIDSGNTFAVQAHGPASSVQEAFGTQIHNFQQNGRTFRANISEARMTGAASSLVSSVGGLNSYGPRPQATLPKNAQTGEPLPAVPMSKVNSSGGGLSGFFTDQCFQRPATFTFGTEGQLPVGVYFGNVYGASSLECAYTAQQLQAAYGLPAAYNQGLDGKGQTIVIVDAYGSPTIQADANLFSSLMGLPALTGSNFQVIYPEGQPANPAEGITEGWNVETSLDVEWVHAIAPKAKIVLLAAASASDEDLQLAIVYAAVNHLGSTISNSYGSPEIENSPATLSENSLVAELAAAVGISDNYGSGDNGDYGLGTPVGAVSTPSDSPYATAVGGTSLGIPDSDGDTAEVGWGNNQTLLAVGTTPSDPPENAGNVDGAGGGQSVFFAKPRWQNDLPGSGRMDPDTAALADPYTGAIVVFTDGTIGQVAEAIGGTSLATPIFSGFWALANQKAGHLLGQAAPILARLSHDALKDIVPVSSPTDVAGTVVDSNGFTFYSAAQLAAPLEGTTKFVSAVWPVQGLYIDLTFGTDTSLHTTVGWDDVTGYGRPNGLPFLNEAANH